MIKLFAALRVVLGLLGFLAGNIALGSVSDTS